MVKWDEIETKSTSAYDVFGKKKVPAKNVAIKPLGNPSKNTGKQVGLPNVALPVAKKLSKVPVKNISIPKAAPKQVGLPNRVPNLPTAKRIESGTFGKRIGLPTTQPPPKLTPQPTFGKRVSTPALASRIKPPKLGYLDSEQFVTQAWNTKGIVKQIEKANQFKFYRSIDVENLISGKRLPTLGIAAAHLNAKGGITDRPKLKSTDEVYKNAATVITQDELGVYNTLIDAGKEDAAKAFIHSILPKVYKRETKNLLKNIEEAGTLENIFNYAAFGKLGGFAYLNTMLTPEGEIDLNSRPYQLAAARKAAMDKLVSESKHPVLASIGLSGVDLLTSIGVGSAGLLAKMGKLTTTSALSMMGSVVSGDVGYDVLERGGTKKQSTTEGGIAAAIEIATGFLPIKHLVKLATPIGILVKEGSGEFAEKVTKSVARQAVGRVFQQVGLQASEELIAEYAQTVLDNAVMGEKSNYNLYKQHLISAGKSEEDAIKTANIAFYITQPAMAAFGGALLGAGFGTPAITIGAVRQAKMEKDARITLAKGGITDKKEQDRTINKIREGNSTATIETIIDKFSSAKEIGTLEGTKPAASINTLAEQAQSVEGGKNWGKLVESVGEQGVEGNKVLSAYYHAGRTGQSFNEIRGDGGALDYAIKEKAFHVGILDASSNLAEVEGKTDVAYGKDSGLVVNGFEENIGSRERHILDSFGKKTGSRIEIVEPDSLKAGEYMEDEFGNYAGEYSDSIYANGTIYIDAAKASEGLAAILLKHELTHRISNMSKEEYQEYRNFVVDSILENGDKELFTERMKQLSDVYSKTKEHQSNEALIDEFVAEFTENFTTNEKAIKSIVASNRSLGQKILTWIKDILAKLRKSAEELTRAEGETYGLNTAQVEKAQALWEKALDAVDIAKVDSENISSETTDKSIDYSLRSANEKAKELAVLKRERARLKERLERAKEEVKRTGAAKTDIREVQKFAKEIIKLYESDYSANALIKELKVIFDNINSAKSEDLDFSHIMNQLFDASYKVLNESLMLVDEGSQTYKDIKYFMRTTPLSIKHISKKGLNDDYAPFMRKNKNIMMLRQEGQDIASFYREMGEDYPAFFPEYIDNSNDQLNYMDEMLDKLEPVYENPYSNNLEDAAKLLAIELYDGYFDIAQRVTFADKQAAKIASAKAEGRRGLVAEKAKSKEQLQAEREKRKEQVQAEREKRQDQVQDQKDQLVAERVNHSLRVKEILGKERERREAVVAKLKESYLSKNSKVREKQKIKILKVKILKKVKPMAKKLLDNNKYQHLPEELRKPIANLFAQIDFSTPRQGEKTKVDLARRKELFRDIADSYQNVIDEQGESATPLNEELVNMLKNAENFISKNHFHEMSVNELESLDTVVSLIKHVVAKTNQSFNEDIKTKLDEDLRSFVDETNYGKNYPRGEKEDSNILRELQGMMRLGMIRPEVYFSELGPTATKYYNEVRKGVDQQIIYTQQARVYTSNLIKGHDLAKWGWHQGLGQAIRDKKAIKSVKFENGTLNLMPVEIMEIYLLSRRKQGLQHLLGDGIKISRTREQMQLTAKDMEMLWNTSSPNSILTPSQVKIAEGLGEFLAKTAKWGNEASMKLYGVKIFTEDNYWTIMVNKNRLDYKSNKGKSNPSLKEYGATKPIKPNAQNQVVIGNVFETYLKQVDFMSNYASLVVPLTDMLRLFNAEDTSIDGKGNEIKLNAKESIENLLGKKGEQYFRTFLDDMNGGGIPEQDVGAVLKFLAWTKRGLILFNSSVVAQQISSLPRAVATGLIEEKYLIASMHNAFNRGEWERVKKYAPIARLKAWGYIDNFINPSFRKLIFRESSEKLFGLPRHGKFQDFASMGMQEADKTTWLILWKASEKQTKVKRKDLIPNTDAFYQEVGRLFSKIIDQTQVVDSKIHRSQMMRNKSTAAKMITAFMSEPTLNYNVAFQAVRNVVKPDGRMSKGAAKKALFVAGKAVLIQQIANSIIRVLISMWRDRYDEEKTFTENVTNDCLLQMSGSAPLFSDITSMFEGYSVDRMDMSGINYFIRALKSFQKFTEGNSQYTGFNVTSDVISSFAQVFGLPVKNIVREMEDLFRNYTKKTDSLLDDYAFAKALHDVKNSANRSLFVAILYEASKKADKRDYKIIYDELIKEGMEIEQIEKSSKDQVKKEEVYKQKLERYTSTIHAKIKKAEGYNNLTEEQQELVLNEAKEYANAFTLKQEYDEKMNNKAAKIRRIQMESGIPLADILIYRQDFKKYMGDRSEPNQQNWLDAMLDINYLSNEQKEWLWTNERDWKSDCVLSEGQVGGSPEEAKDNDLKELEYSNGEYDDYSEFI